MIWGLKIIDNTILKTTWTTMVYCMHQWCTILCNAKTEKLWDLHYGMLSTEESFLFQRC